MNPGYNRRISSSDPTNKAKVRNNCRLPFSFRKFIIRGGYRGCSGCVRCCGPLTRHFSIFIYIQGASSTATPPLRIKKCPLTWGWWCNTLDLLQYSLRKREKAKNPPKKPSLIKKIQRKLPLFLYTPSLKILDPPLIIKYVVFWINFCIPTYCMHNFETIWRTVPIYLMKR
jgi:hypothetical protein